MDFLTFKSFISTEVLILFYYLGALVLPLALWRLFSMLTIKYQLLNNVYENGKTILWQSLNKRQRGKFLAAVIISFLFLELFWRMLFEFLIAYMQIRDALIQTQAAL